jgi:CubicO group peptidase (beta-lactamase class C family)
MFTAVAIAQLEQEGRLSFEDTLSKYLPDYPNKDAANKVKLHDLLTHTSGIGDYFTKEFMEASRERFRTVRDFFPLFADKPLIFEPGSRFRYSNAGYLLLGAVIEKVTGQSYFDYVREHIFRPTEMSNTGYFDMDRDTPNLAIGYTREVPESGKLGSLWKNNLFMHVIRGGPAGGGFSTVEDLLRFVLALRSHKLLDQKRTEMVLSPKTNFGESTTRKYGYGFILETVGGTRIAGHGGGFPGINGQLDMYLDKGYTVIALTNYDMAAHRVAEKARRLITAK